MIEKKPNKKKAIYSKVISLFRDKKSTNVFRILLITFLVMLNVIIGMTIEYYVIKKTYLDNYNKINDEKLNEFIDNYQYIINNYYGDIDKDQLIDSAISGMIEALGDDYSTFLSETEKNNYDLYLKGSFVGLGIKLSITSNKEPFVYYVFPNSPASKVGIKVGDLLLKIDDIDVSDKKTEEISEIIKNKKDSFNITIQREEKLTTFLIKKGKIELDSVYSKTFEDNIGYIRVDIFAANTYEQFEKKLADLEKQNIKGLIIDFRDNSGGYLTTVEKMISLFLDKSHVIYQTEDKKQVEKVYSTGQITKKYPIVLLSNRNSASGSEVMIGALKEEYGALQVGETTFGKGTVQKMSTLSDGEQYKITIKKWLTPSGSWINKIGIKPDFEIMLDEEYYSNPSIDTDKQLIKALELIKK